MGPLQGASIACVDIHGDLVAQLVGLCRSVLCIALDKADEAHMQARASHEGWQGVDVVRFDRLAATLGRPGLQLDGVICHDVQGWVEARLPGGMAALVACIRPYMPEGAFVYLAGLNRWRIPRAPADDTGWPRRATQWLGLRRALRRQALQSVAVHPLLTTDDGRVTDIVAAGGYKPTRNHGLTVERIKSWVWGRWTSRWFAPAVAAVGWVGPRAPTLLSRVEARLRERTAEVSHWNQIILLRGGKVVVAYPAATPAGGSGCVVVATRDPLSVARREREGRVIDLLHERLPASLSALIPRARDRFEVCGLECFVLERIVGVTADAVVPGMSDVNRNALGFLLEVHRASAHLEPMDAQRWAAHLRWIFEQALHRNPGVAAELQQIEAAVRLRVIDRPWIEVITHGDFKIENVMYDPQTRALTGVIDWEHAMLSGFPYIDLAYLMVYNRMLAGQTWFQAATDLLLSDEMSPEERTLELDYWREVGAGERLTPLLRALAPVHHIGCRRHGIWPGDQLTQLRVLMRHCLQMIEAVPIARNASEPGPEPEAAPAPGGVAIPSALAAGSQPGPAAAH